jgi:hypothetical protein
MSSKSKNVSNPTPKTGKTAGDKRSASPTSMDVDSDKKKGKNAFLAAMKSEGVVTTRTLKSSNGATPMVACEAIVIGTNAISVKGKKEGTTVPKLEVTAITRMVRTNGAPDCVDSAIPGMAFLLPTIKPTSSESSADDGPEAALANRGKGGAGADKKPPAPPRTMSLTEGHKTVWLGFIKTSIYTTAPGGGEDATNAKKPDLDLIKPGAVVEIAGNVANLGADGRTLWLNSARVTPLRDDFDSINTTDTLINEFMKPESALAGAFIASQCANGFFGADFGTDETRAEQAQLFHRMWSGLTQNLSKSCESLAASLRASSPDEESNAKILDSHALRLKETSPDEIASGAGLLFIPTMMPTQDKPAFCAPLVQFGKHAAMPMPSVIMDLLDKHNVHTIPKTFVSLDLREVEFQGAAINLKGALFLVADKDVALQRLDEGTNPILSTGKFASIGIKLNMRTFCGTLGTLVKSKAEMAAKELLVDADIATVAKICPKPFSTDGIQCCFPESFSVDMLTSIPKVAMPVTEKWIQDKMCGGATQFVFEPDADVPNIKEKDGRTDVNVTLPQLKASGYQAISESGFKFAMSKSPLDRPVKKYFVLFDGCRDIVAEEGSLTIEQGEEIVESAAKTDGSEIADFLAGKCIVYCVSAHAPPAQADGAGASTSA